MWQSRPTSFSTYARYILQYMSKHDVAGKLSVVIKIRDYTWYVLGETCLSNNTIHIKLDCYYIMSYVSQTTPCHQGTVKVATDKQSLTRPPRYVNTLRYDVTSIIANMTQCYVQHYWIILWFQDVPLWAMAGLAIACTVFSRSYPTSEGRCEVYNSTYFL